jgi:hypothetical protein
MHQMRGTARVQNPRRQRYRLGVLYSISGIMGPRSANFGKVGFLHKGIKFYLRFYWECAKEAAKGSMARANAVAGLLGALILWLLLLWLGFKLDAPHTVTGHLELGVAAAFASVILAWLAIIILRFLGAPARLYLNSVAISEGHQNELAALKSQFLPQIKVFISPVDNGVQEAPWELQGEPVRRGMSKWVQVSVACATRAPLVDCEVWLVAVERIGGLHPGEQLVEEDVRCGWSQYAENKLTLSPLRTQRANLFALYDHSPSMIFPQTDPLKFRLRDGMAVPGVYRISLVITAAYPAPSHPASFIFQWQDYNKVFLKPA